MLFHHIFVLMMRNHLDISLARFLMVFSLVLLGILEYLWLHNEYKNKYRDMEDNLSHVMFTTSRDIEDSLIFSKLTTVQNGDAKDSSSPRTLSFVVNEENIVGGTDRRTSTKVTRGQFTMKERHPMRGLLLKELKGDSASFDTSMVNIGSMVMNHLRLADSTGEFDGYQVISWEGGDTMIAALRSKPMMDALAGKKMALINPNYKADIFHDLLPHMSFALFLWGMVGAAFYYIWKNLRKQIQLNALRDEFVSNITHELKTPITTVGVALESLNFSQDFQSVHSKRYLDICRSELNRLSILVERILSNRSPQMNYEKMDVRQVLDDVMHHMKVQFDNKGADVDIHQEGENFMIKGDKSHMSGVLYNLLDNALKYSKGNPVIHVNLIRQNGTVRLDIQDNGIGIESDYHDKIFEKLFRVPQRNKHDVKGHGLGLSYVADVIKQHHGQISLVSEPGKGSTFSMTLPAWDFANSISEGTASTQKDNHPIFPKAHLN